MSNKKIKPKILLRNDTLANWQASTSILDKGEPAIVFDPNPDAEDYTIRVKIGDGVHIFSDLPYSDINDDLLGKY